VAVLNCIPADAGQERAVAEVRRVLRPGGVLFVSDYPLQTDERSLARYRRFASEPGAYGTFRADGGVFRHLDLRRLPRLLADFTVVRQWAVRVHTMGGNEAEAFQLAARRDGG
jgi:SAM-dependent methyltransferase